MATKEHRLTLACDLCGRSSKPGYLWLGGSDYVECPQCGGDKKMDIVERLIVPGLTFVSRGIPR